MRLKRQFCRWALRMIREDPTYFWYVPFSVEASFHNNGFNCHYYSTLPELLEEVDPATRQKI